MAIMTVRDMLAHGSRQGERPVRRSFHRPAPRGNASSGRVVNVFCDNAAEGTRLALILQLSLPKMATVRASSDWESAPQYSTRRSS
jgi:hypothetical protein